MEGKGITVEEAIAENNAVLEKVLRMANTNDLIAAVVRLAMAGGVYLTTKTPEEVLAVQIYERSNNKIEIVAALSGGVKITIEISDFITARIA